MEQCKDCRFCKPYLGENRMCSKLDIVVFDNDNACKLFEERYD